MTTDQTTLPAWAKGYPLQQLRQLAALYKPIEDAHVHGAFGRTKEREVAEWLAAGRLVHGSDWAFVVQPVLRPQAVKDFTGRPRFTMPAGALHVHHLAGDVVNASFALAAFLRGDAAVELYFTGFTERPTDRRFAEAYGLVPLATKISAASDMRTVWGPPGQAEPYTPITAATLVPLRLGHIEGLVDALVERLRRQLFDWQDHYAPYNVGHTWSALSLHGYSEDAHDIVKPAEMSKAWKAEHPLRLTDTLRDTWLRPLLPEVEPLLALLPGTFERVRLMRLQPGGGELTRHADITDPDVGTEPGQTLRIHVPLVTNPHVTFTAWCLDGSTRTVHMPAGTAWYLDTRKGHTAVNNGLSERIHLVVDVFSSPELLQLLDTDAMGPVQVPE